MTTKTEARDLINEIFEEEALLIGGLVAVHDVDDDVVWRLIRNLDVLRCRFLRRFEDQVPPDEAEPPRRRPNLNPHPAIEDFLLTLRRS